MVKTEIVHSRILVLTRSMCRNDERMIVSYPFLSFYKGMYAFACLLSIQTKDMYHRGTALSPHVCMMFDYIDGYQLGSAFPSGNFDFLCIQKEVCVNESSCAKPAINFMDTWETLMDHIRADMIEKNTINEKEYKSYLSYILPCVPEGMRAYYEVAGIPFHPQLPILSMGAKLPVDVKYMDTDRILAECLCQTIYVLLNKDTVIEKNDILSAEPLAAKAGERQAVFISNDSWCIRSMAISSGMVHGDIPMVGIITATDKYDGFSQFVKYVYHTYAESIIFMSCSKAGRFQKMLSVTVKEVAAKISVNLKDMSDAAMECSAKKMLLHGKYHKTYKVDMTGYYDAVMDNLPDEKPCESAVPSVLYVLMNHDTGFPVISYGRAIYLYSSIQAAYTACSDLLKKYGIHAQAQLLHQSRYKEIFHTFFCEEGYMGAYINPAYLDIYDENVPFAADVFLHEEDSIQDRPINGFLILYRQCMLSEKRNPEKTKEAKLKFLLALSKFKVMVPSLAKDGTYIPVFLQKNTETILPVYTNARLLKDVFTTHYAYVISVSLPSLETQADLISVNFGGRNSIEIPMRWGMDVIKCAMIIPEQDDMLRIQKSCLFGKYPAIAGEYFRACAERKFQRVHAVRVNEKTAEMICSEQKVNIHEAYWSMVLAMESFSADCES